MRYLIGLARRAVTPLPLVLLALAITVSVLAACGGAAAPTAAPRAPAAAAQPTSAPAVQSTNRGAPAATAAAPAEKAQPSTGGVTSDSAAPSSLAPNDRKIIKNAQLTLIVEKTSTGVERITQIAVDVGGYLNASHSFAEGNSTGAQVIISVPVDRFEEALNLVRKVAIKITSDTTSSSDVSDQYTDLVARQKNLEATRDRIRQFLDKAVTVDEALKVNQQLSDVESQIEQIKGKLNVLDARTSFSTITADLHEPVPTPTPTPTFTPTPTPTPIGWNPGATFEDAARVQTSLLRTLGDLLIWLIVVLLPYVLVFALIALGATWLIRRFAKPTPRQTPQ